MRIQSAKSDGINLVSTGVSQERSLSLPATKMSLFGNAFRWNRDGIPERKRGKSFNFPLSCLGWFTNRDRSENSRRGGRTGVGNHHRRNLHRELGGRRIGDRRTIGVRKRRAHGDGFVGHEREPHCGSRDHSRLRRSDCLWRSQLHVPSHHRSNRRWRHQQRVDRGEPRLDHQ